MPFELRYDREKKILCVTLVGNVDVHEFDAAMRAIVSSDDYPPDTPTLWDVRWIGVTSDPLPVRTTADEKQLLFEMIERRKRYPERGHAKIAIIVPNDFIFGMSRMYEMLSDQLPQNIMVFRDYVAGEQWLAEV